ncbi:MAG: hypothetical protein KC964_24465 [Candidatus Omnitrophica bacterium]|nr:hypothetical protein [Candidatus Omnitrophota bacterium]
MIRNALFFVPLFLLWCHSTDASNISQLSRKFPTTNLTDTDTALDQLLAEYSTSTGLDRRFVLYRISQLKQNALPAIPVILESSTTVEAKTKIAIADALAAIDPDNEIASNQAAQLLVEGNATPMKTLFALAGFRVLGLKAKSLVRDFESSRDLQTQIAARACLYSSTTFQTELTDSDINLFKNGLESNSSEDRRLTVRWMGRMSPNADNTVPLLVNQLLDEKDLGVKITIAEALRQNCQLSSDALPALQALFDELEGMEPVLSRYDRLVVWDAIECIKSAANKP